MKDLSLLLFHNSLGAKMMKNFRAFCNGDSSTSTLNQRHHSSSIPPPPHSLLEDDDDEEEEEEEEEENSSPPPTLEEMIMQLEIEEKLARRKSRLDEYVGVGVQRRMSCVNNSDILRSARNALNQYPRFSLDGKDAMYRSSFRNSSTPPPLHLGRKSFCCNRQLRMAMDQTNISSSSRRCMPRTLGGESVVWCKPGVVAKLMGLEAMPVPVNGYNNNYYYSCGGRSATLSSILKRQSKKVGVGGMLLHDNVKSSGCNVNARRRKRRSSGGGAVGGSSTATNYCVMKPIAKQYYPPNDEAGWPVRYFL